MPFSAATSASGSTSDAAARFSRRCPSDDVPGISRMLGARRSVQAVGDGRQHRRLQRAEPAQGKERHIGDSVLRERIDQGVVAAMSKVVVVLHAGDLGHGASLLHLSSRDVAEPDMAHQSLPLQIDERFERRGDRSFRRPVRVEHGPQVNDVESLQSEVAQIVVDGTRQLVRAEGRTPRRILAAPRADLCHDDEVVLVGRQRFADQLIGDERPVEVAGVDVVDAGGHRFSQDGERRFPVARRPEHAGSGELHGAVAQPLDGAATQDEAAGLITRLHICLLHVHQVSLATQRDKPAQSARVVLCGEQ